MMIRRLVFVIIGIAASAGLSAADKAIILPSEVKLSSSEARQSLIVEHVRDGKYFGQISDEITIVSSDEKIVKIVDGFAIPVANGEAKLSAKTKFGDAKAKVVVSGMDKPFVWSFRNHVQPVLMRTGCSTGACHGAAAGKANFRLSLRGYDDEGDFNAITRHSLGRRVIPSDPGRSLLLTKPTGATPHKGGIRFNVDSLEFRVVSEWIAAGMPPPKPDDVRIKHIQVLPEDVTLKKDAAQQMIVLAHFSDGSVQDVTAWTRFTSANQSVATIDDNGLVKVVGNGDGAISAWYLSRIAIASVSAPFEKPVSPEVFAKAPRRNFIDELVLEKLQMLNLPPSPRAADDEFVRRAFIDTIGALPTAEETRAFLADKAADKRDALIEKLLERPEFVDYWSYKWSDLLLVNSEKLKPPAMWSYYRWIREQVQANTPWDKFVRQLVTAKGSTLENGAGNFFVLHEDPTLIAETLSVAFMGLSINCAKCHNHPLEKWTNDQYYGMANLIARVRTKNLQGEGNRMIFAATEGDLIQPLTGKPQAPQPLDGVAIAIDSPEDRREHLANWLTAKDNTYFSRTITNRIWANFMGLGLVESVDDLRITNPASNEKLLTAAAKYLVDNNFDLKVLMRAILQSETYQRSSMALEENKGDTRYYARFYPRRLKAEVLLDAMSQVTGAPTEFANYPKGYRALQLPDSNVASYFLKSFGRPNRVQTCECERTDSPSMAQVLHIANGDTMNKKLAEKENRVGEIIQKKTASAEVIDELYLAALSRFPTETEKTKLQKALEGMDDSNRRQMLEDLYWGVLSSKEFLFNH